MESLGNFFATIEKIAYRLRCYVGLECEATISVPHGSKTTGPPHSEPR